MPLASTPHHQGRRHSSVYPFLSHLKQHPGKSIDGPTISRSIATRRISEGESGRVKESLRCQSCGKAYKHISSLAKHLWEHTPEWTMTKKLLISKHQQVQLLEAASILVGMNEPEDFVHLRRHSHSAVHGQVFEELEEYEQVPSSYSPMPGCVGGYIDVPKFKQLTVTDPEEEQDLEKAKQEIKQELKLGKPDAMKVDSQSERETEKPEPKLESSEPKST